MALIRFVLTVGAVTLLQIGCNHAPTTGQVKGSVTLDGKPLEDGTVRFAPLEGRANTSGGLIKSGEFTANVPIGKFRVEISSTKIVGGPADRHSDSVETVVQLIPEKYNTRSELTLDVKSGSNEPHFDLKSR
jgi:hypothetical protein